MVRLIILILSLLPINLLAQSEDLPDEFVVYSVNSRLNMGNPGERQIKDFYVNMGRKHGLKRGEKLRVVRRMATYDLQNSRLFQDVEVPIGHLKVIHVDESASIARMDSLYPSTQRPVISPEGVAVGDLIEVVR